MTYVLPTPKIVTYTTYWIKWLKQISYDLYLMNYNKYRLNFYTDIDGFIKTYTQMNKTNNY